ncbi:hypothetical protein, partial [Microbacterium ginsengisoli]|uniref:hypothetical protein n=1 Tax=Microbacterium ginsengisoli TaxID=400772 RepID=UPI001B80DF56
SPLPPHSPNPSLGADSSRQQCCEGVESAGRGGFDEAPPGVRERSPSRRRILPGWRGSGRVPQMPRAASPTDRGGAE